MAQTPGGLPPYPEGGGAPPSQPWGGDGFTPSGPSRARNGIGTASLVTGILSIPGILTIVLGVILGVLGVIFGIVGIRRAGRGEATNRSSAIAGVATGAIGLVVSLVFVAIGTSFFLSHRSQIHNYSECISHAKTAQARSDCTKEFNRQIGR